MADRYQMANDFLFETSRREIKGCENVETLQNICLTLLQSNAAQKRMLSKLMLDQIIKD